jgi:AcrR family transcriptional regulator
MPDEFDVNPSAPAPTQRRARPSGRRPGDSGTREAIAAAARRQFAERGYDRTSLRSVALEAGVDPSLVSHFYGSKPQLFASAIELPFEPAQILPVLLTGDRDELGLRVARFLVSLLESEDARRPVIGLVRSAVSAPEAAAMVRELISSRLLAALAENLGVDHPRLRGSLVGAQVVGLVMSRYVVELEPLASLPPDAVAAAIAPNLQRLLVDPLPADVGAAAGELTV